MSSSSCNNQVKVAAIPQEEQENATDKSGELLEKAKNTRIVKSMRESSVLNLESLQNNDSSFLATTGCAGDDATGPLDAAFDENANDLDSRVASAKYPDQKTNDERKKIQEPTDLANNDSKMDLNMDLNMLARSSASSLISRSASDVAAAESSSSSSAFTLQNIIARPSSAASNVSSANVNTSMMQPPSLPSVPSLLYPHPLSAPTASSESLPFQLYNSTQPPQPHTMQQFHSHHSAPSFNSSNQAQQYQQRLIQGMHQQIHQQMQQQQQQTQQQPSQRNQINSSFGATKTSVEDMVDAAKTQRGKRATICPDGVKRYFCKFDGCGRFFSTSGHLTRHFKIHTGEKTHPCPILHCASLFSRKDNMLQHFIAHRKKLQLLNSEILFKPAAQDQEKSSLEAMAASSKRGRKKGGVDGEEGGAAKEEKPQVIRWHGENPRGKKRSRVADATLEQKHTFVTNDRPHSIRQELKPPFLELSHLQNQSAWPERGGRDQQHQQQIYLPDPQHQHYPLNHSGPLSAPPFVSSASSSSFLSNTFPNNYTTSFHPQHSHHQSHPDFRHSNSSPHSSPPILFNHFPPASVDHTSRFRSQTTPQLSLYDPNSYFLPNQHYQQQQVHDHEQGVMRDLRGGYSGGCIPRPASTPALAGSLYSALMRPDGFYPHSVDHVGGEVDVGDSAVGGISVTPFGSPQFVGMINVNNSTAGQDL